MSQMFRLQIDDQKRCYGPGDRITGSVVFSPQSVMHIAAVVITFSAKSNIFYKCSSNKELFSMPLTLYENDKSTAQPALQPGQHQWPFDFKFPESHRLPPSFVVHLTGPSYSVEALLDEPRQFRASVIYTLEARILQDGAVGLTIQKAVNFSPHRLALLEDGPVPYLCPSFASRSVLGGLTKRKERTFTLKLGLPRFAVISEPLSLPLGIDYGSQYSDVSKGCPVICLKSFQTTLQVVNTIKDQSIFGGSDTQIETCCGPSGEDLDYVINPAKQIDLNALDPTFRLSDALKIKPPSGSRAGAPSLIVPTFETLNNTRTYRLPAVVKVRDMKNTLVAHLGGKELVVLPAQWTPKIVIKPRELDPDATLLELPSERPEAWSGRKGQIDTIELPAVTRPVELG
ncbi:MAG: hypothetical protein M1835_004754 [Candelina submexicana]|nr:MAG: hypothetical protein M1835_004754 [Candelina submexicana]